MTAALACLALAPTVQAQSQNRAWVPGKGHGWTAISYQDLFISTHTLSNGDKGFPGSITNHSVFLALDYGLSDRLAMTLGLPYKSNRFEGPGPHNPSSLIDHHGQDYIDDGQYHSGWQDWNVGLRYLWRDQAWKVTPFVSYGHPSHDYTTFAHSALGTNQQALQLGLNVGRFFNPPYQSLFVQASYAYSILEQVGHDRRVNHSTINLELGYFFTPRLSTSLVVSAQKTHNGYDFPQDYPNRRDEHYLYHDQNLRNDFVNVGATVNYQASERYSVFVAFAETVWGENTHLIDHAVTLGASRSF